MVRVERMERELRAGGGLAVVVTLAKLAAGLQTGASEAECTEGRFRL